ncbi:unnamed protein product [Cuscuta epithymum]|uniref:Uncharacterized protein n=1 Tax=Cuscuta epithymum TaxID=186058 RepID=A0AAV0G3I7_9ASTE|nr:unnamed protein product [Cuscuta epithymum]
MIITIFLHHDRPLSAIVSRFTVRLAHFPPGWRRTSYAVRSAPQRHRTWLHGSAHPFPPGWRRPSYAARSASQRHRVSFTFGSPHSLQDGDERLMQCDRPLSAIVPGFTVRLAHSLQDGDDRLMRHDRLLSAIVSLSRSDRPIPSRMATNVSYAARTAPQRHRVWFTLGSPIPSRMATNVSYAARSAPQRHRVWLTLGSPHSLQDGDERLMQCDRPLSAIVPGFTVRIAPFPPGWRRPSYAARSAPQCHRVWLTLGSPIPFRMATNVSYAARSAPQRHRVWLTLGSPIPFRMATNVFMQHDQRLSAIVSGSR